MNKLASRNSVSPFHAVRHGNCGISISSKDHASVMTPRHRRIFFRRFGWSNDEV